ncbi:hypothetical protein ACI77O_12120 [Pseudomonas tritici]|uniref:hypothetical protein n=1 Tax=Pseudomonas tritici TaxID=2745518 RepID=UPI00387B10DD
MNESACITDMNLYEHHRHNWMLDHNGALDGFTCPHGEVVAREAANYEPIKAHTLIPGHIEALVLTNDNRLPLGASINANKKHYAAVTQCAVDEAIAFVSRLFSVSLGEVRVYLVKSAVMSPASAGAVYSNGVKHHIVVVPETSYDPTGVLVAQLAIAAHYTLMREKPGLAAMISDPLTQAMVAHFAVLTFAAQNPTRCSVMQHLQQLVTWEFAKGLSKTPETPMGFVVSDLGEQLMKAYGGGMFRAVMQELYESMTHGKAIYFGCNNFNGMALALALLGDEQGMTRFMKIDTGDRKLADKLFDAFPGLNMQGIAGFQGLFNERLEAIIAGVATEAA